MKSTILQYQTHHTIPADTIAPPVEPGFPTIGFLGLKFAAATLAEAAERLTADAEAGRRCRLSFINAHCVNVAAKDPVYVAALSRSDVLLADGVGMAMAARLWGIRLRDNVNGTDLFPLLCERAAHQDIGVALLGARPGLAERCAERMQARYPGLRVVWTHHGFYSPEEESRIIRDINSSGARILLVAMGVPLQELWIDRHAHRLSVPVLAGVGALFDFYSGAVRRCPKALRRLHLEWLFRLMLEPRRLFRRYVVGNPLFICRIVRRRLRNLT